MFNSTFNLPDLNIRVPCYDSGRVYGSEDVGSIPNLYGTIQTSGVVGEAYSVQILGTGVFINKLSDYCHQSPTQGSMANIRCDFDASLYNPIYSNSAMSVKPASINMYYVIKY